MSHPQPAVPTNIPVEKPLILTPENLETLTAKLDEWLAEISSCEDRPEKIRLTHESVRELRKALNNFLHSIEFVETLHIDSRTH